MTLLTQRFSAGQIRGTWFKRGTALVAIDGTVRVTYRDASLDWMPDAAPQVSMRVRPGDCHVMPFDAFVELSPEGLEAVSVRIGSVAARRRSWLAVIERAVAALGLTNRLALRRGQRP
jgi:hypothetical protein